MCDVVLSISEQTHNTRVVSSNPACVTRKTQLVGRQRKATL